MPRQIITLTWLIVAAAAPATAQTVPAAASAAADEQALRRLWSEFEAAFNRGDAKAIAAFFAEDADRVSGARRTVGRAEIERDYAAALAARRADPSAVPFRPEITVRVVRPDVALLDGAWSGVRSGKPVSGRFTFVATRSAGRWWLSAGRAWELPLEP